MKAGKQTTLRDQTAVSGIGVHSGLPATLTMLPADADTGIVFVRCGTDGQPRPRNPRRRPRRHRDRIRHRARRCDRARCARPPSMCSRRCRGLGVDNAIIEIDGPEVPIMDGSAAPFVDAIDQAGLDHAAGAAPLHPASSSRSASPSGDAYGELRPHPQRLPRRARDRFRPSADRPAGDRARRRARHLPPRAGARPHLRLHARRGEAVERGLCARRLVREHAGRQRQTALLNPEGLRFADEFARHKALDAIGDLALAGAPLLGAYRSVRGGHKLNHAVLSALMADPSAWTLVEGPEIRPEVRQDTPPRGAAPRDPRPCRPGHRPGGAGLRAGRLLSHAALFPADCPHKRSVNLYFSNR